MLCEPSAHTHFSHQGGEVVRSLSKQGSVELLFISVQKRSLGTGSLLHRAEQEGEEEMSPHSCEAFTGP